MRTDNGHRFQASFHWQVENLGIHHVYIKPRSLRINGKVERSHQTNDLEFYVLLGYTADVDLSQRLRVWEDYYNFHRPRGSLKGKAPYEILREKLSDGQKLFTEV